MEIKAGADCIQGVRWSFMQVYAVCVRDKPAKAELVIVRAFATAEAPSIPLVTGLLDIGAKVRAYDPVGMEQARAELPNIEYCEDAYACANGADALVIVTEWVQFRALDLGRLRAVMAQPVVVDLRNVYRPEDMAAAGFVYEIGGRPTLGSAAV